jgi:tetratricopeptide (TPR) repeat protein
VFGRAIAEATRAWLAQLRGDLEESETTGEKARALFAEIGFAAWEASAMYHLARVVWARGDLPRAEKLLRDSVRMLKGIGDRAHLCEAQRTLAQLLVDKGEVAEAERVAHEARESVGHEDRASVSTTKLALGVVRAAQGRDDEAEALMREALRDMRAFGLRAVEREVLLALVDFYRDRGRDDEVPPLEERLAELVSGSKTARIA